MNSFSIQPYPFSKEGLVTLEANPRGRNWPVVYLIDNDKELYVGETTSAGVRFRQHLENPDRKKLRTVQIIFDEEFNKSAILDIEQTLIQMFQADRKMKLQNKNGGQSSKHDYYQRTKYQNKVDDIWNELHEMGLTRNSAHAIRNSNLFKYSPFNTLTSEQEAVSQEIISNILDCLRKGKKGSAVLHGVAGTGKSIVLINMIYTLLNAMDAKYDDSDLSPEERFELDQRISLGCDIRDYVKDYGPLKIGFVVPMTSIRETFRTVFRNSREAHLSTSMVIGPNDVLKKKYDVIFVDEAHRLARRKSLTSYGSFDDACKKLGLDPVTSTQLDMIQKCSRYSVLVYDSNQTVKSSDITPEQFDGAMAGRVRTDHYLSTQMRCEGGNSLLDYLSDIFDCKASGMVSMEKEYDLRLWDDPNAMIDKIRQLDKTYSLCRNLAGYAWPWKSKNCTSVEDALAKDKADIVFGDRKYVWNMNNKEWILRPGAVNEIGCIHTTQGYDLNYAGIIMGKEIDYDPDNKCIVTYRNLFHDKKVKSGVSDDQLTKYIINSYKVMMVRGIKGCYIYACNKNLRDYLSRFIPIEDLNNR